MKKLFTFMAVAALMMAAGCGNSKQKAAEKEEAAEKIAVVEKMDAEHVNVTNDGIVPSNGLPMVVDFSAEWCPPCRKLKPIFAALREEYKGKVDFASIDVDSMPDLATKYNVISIPALVYLNPKGEEVYRTVGFREADSIKADIASHFK